MIVLVLTNSKMSTIETWCETCEDDHLEELPNIEVI